MYLVYRAQLPEHIELDYDRQARQLLAKLLDESPDPFPREFLHLRKNGYLGGLSPYRTRGVRGCLEISAVGQVATERLAEHAHRVTAALSRYAGAPVSETRSAGICDLSEGARLNYYVIHSLVFQRRPSLHREIMQAKDPERAQELVQTLVEERIRSGIERQANFLGIDVPYYMLGNISFGQPVPVLVKPGKFNLTAKVNFQCSLIFSGPWHVGYLVSRGYGRIANARRPARKENDSVRVGC